MAYKPENISRDDYYRFCMTVWNESPTMTDFDEWFDLYEELLRLIFWNPEIDTPKAIQSRER